MSDNYEDLYWKELEENIKLNEEIDRLKWKIYILESKIKSLESKSNLKEFVQRTQQVKSL